MMDAEKRATGKVIDLDIMLLFLVEQWREEAGRAEERLRALFVASDTDGDRNLDFAEFSSMINHISTGKGYRECLRMYGEMTLNKIVDCNTFVRVCRKFRFFTFEVGPASKKADKGAAEVFELIIAEWKKIEDVVNELLVVLQGTTFGKRLEQVRLSYGHHTSTGPEICVISYLNLIRSKPTKVFLSCLKCFGWHFPNS